METTARTAETTRTTCPFANLLALDPTDSAPSMATDLTGGVGYKVLGESGMYMNNLVDAVHGVNMTVKEDVIKAMKEAGKPMSAGEVEKATGIDRKEIDKAFKELKAEGAIVSPVRCKWEPAQ